jgi:hypoxanthine phosphoribosyltransferase
MLDSESVAAPEPVEHSFMTMDDVMSTARSLADLARKKNGVPDMVIGIANGGTLLAYLVAQALGCPLKIVAVQRQGSIIKQRLRPIIDFFHVPPSWILNPLVRPLWSVFQRKTSGLVENKSSFDFSVEGQDILLVDDCVESGRTIEYIKPRLAGAGARRITLAVISVVGLERAGRVVEPEILLTRVFQFYPWSNNSPHHGAYTAFMAKNNIQIYK